MAPAWAALPKPDEVVQITAAEFGGIAQRAPALHVNANILPGWHINSDKPASPDYIATKLTIVAPQSIRIKDIRYPPAQMIAPEFSMGEKLSVFTGAVTFDAPLEQNTKPSRRPGAHVQPVARLSGVQRSAMFAPGHDYQTGRA